MTDMVLENRDNGRKGGSQNISKFPDFIEGRPLRLHKMGQKTTRCWKEVNTLQSVQVSLALRGGYNPQIANPTFLSLN